MKIAALVFVAVLSVSHQSVVALPVAQNPAEASGANDFVLAKGRAGNIQVGISVDDLVARVGLNNTKLLDLQVEGMFSPVVRVTVPGGTGHVDAEVRGYPCEDFWVSRLFLTDRRFKTARGIGVGLTYGQLRKAYKSEPPGNGEGGVYVFVGELEMSFGFDSTYYGRPSQLPVTARITSVLLLPPRNGSRTVAGCPQAAR